MKLTCVSPTRKTLTVRLWVVEAEHATEATTSRATEKVSPSFCSSDIGDITSKLCPLVKNFIHRGETRDFFFAAYSQSSTVTPFSYICVCIFPTLNLELASSHIFHIIWLELRGFYSKSINF